MSIISDQTQGREEGTCAESERKEGKWEEKTAGYIAVPGTQGERQGPRGEGVGPAGSEASG